MRWQEVALVTVASAPTTPATRTKIEITTVDTLPTAHFDVGIPGKTKGVNATLIPTMHLPTLTRVEALCIWVIVTWTEKHATGKLEPGKFFWEMGKYTQRLPT